MPVIENKQLKPVTMFDGVTGYFADADGRIWSNKRGELIQLREYVGAYGYLVCALYVGGYKAIRRPIHRVIATTFLGKRPDGMVCRHHARKRLDW